jgi:hypothetical protein
VSHRRKKGGISIREKLKKFLEFNEKENTAYQTWQRQSKRKLYSHEYIYYKNTERSQIMT